MIIAVFLLSDSHVEGLNPLRTVSSGGRITGISQSIEVFSKSPLYGVGFNAYRYAQLRFGLREPVGTSISNSDAGADNSFLLVLATSGVVGFLFYVLSFVFLLNVLMKNLNSFSHIEIAIIASLFGGALFTNILFYTPIIGVFFLLVPFGLNKAKVDK